MCVFISGIMQGSLPGVEVHGQDYRGAIREIILARHPEAEIIDPWELHPESPSYDPERGKRTFLELIEEAGRADIVVAYLREASMGTAIEMWQAYERGLPILTISPLAENWVVKFLSTRVFPSMEAFAAFVERGGLEIFESRILRGQLLIDLETRRVTRGGRRVYLTKLEFDLLAYLARNAPRVVPYDELLHEVWGYRWSQGSYDVVKGYVSVG